MTEERESDQRLKDPEALHTVNARILRGELTIEEAIQRNLASRQQIREWQNRYLVSGRTDKPWESILSTAWSIATRRRRRYVTLPVFLIFIVLPAAASIYESGAKLWQGFLKAFSARTSEMYPPERDVCNEWVARVGRFDKRDHAQSAKEELRSAMEREDEVTWADKVYIVRDIEASDHYLLVVDMFSGPSDAGSVSDEIQRIRAAHPGVLGSALEASGPFYYRASLFEKRYGKLAPSALRCYYKEE